MQPKWKRCVPGLSKAPSPRTKAPGIQFIHLWLTLFSIRSQSSWVMVLSLACSGFRAHRVSKCLSQSPLSGAVHGRGVGTSAGISSPQTLLEEARRLGVPVLPPCLHRSETNIPLNPIQPSPFDSGSFSRHQRHQRRGRSRHRSQRAIAPFACLDDALERLTLPLDHWEVLVRSGALASFGERRKVLWQVRATLRERQGTKGKRGNHADQLRLDMPGSSSTTPFNIANPRTIEWDFATMNLTTGPHPLSLHRPKLDKLGVWPICELKEQQGGIVRVGGSVISRQRPPTAKGMCFLILQDETGYVPTAMVSHVYEQFERVLARPSL